MQDLSLKASFELLELKKSQFYAAVFSVTSFADAEQILQTVRQNNKKATHVCYAVVINTEQVVERCSDDGEPSGTAGKPILMVMKKNNLTNALVVVVRYFGGIKLGAGGLIRAYVKSASLAINAFNNNNKE